MAFKEGMKKADPVIKEPIMLVNVIVPDEYLGFVIGDLHQDVVWLDSKNHAAAVLLR